MPARTDADVSQAKHALITGSSRGIGRGIALKLAEGGATMGGAMIQFASD
jgi:NAD(P)-dependent dehydrogenase (short-subunit alcohol dehydrogenase family)